MKTILQRVTLAVVRLKAASVVCSNQCPRRLADSGYNGLWNLLARDVERVPGGSSKAPAAALAAGLCGFRSGSDIGGSIRNPSHFVRLRP